MGALLKNKIALITGGSAGIGLATARTFIEEGALVYVTGRRQAELDSAVSALGANAVGLRADAANLGDIRAVYDRISRDHGRLDVLYANAGFYAFATLGDIGESHVDTTFDTNVKGVVFAVQEALPLMRQGGSIVLTGSVVGNKGVESFSIYAASKAAVRSLARSWTAELKDRGIRVNVISPGPIDTPGLSGLAAGADQLDELKRQLIATVPMNRMGAPEDVAKAVLFLASDMSAFVSGIELAVDGGAGQV